MAATFTPSWSAARIEPIALATPSTALRLKASALSTVTFDRTWSPYIQGTLVCRAQTAAEANATDPRQGLGVKLTLGQTFRGVAQSFALAGWLRSRSSDLVANETTITFASLESLMQDYVDSAGMTYSTAKNDTDVVADVLDYMRWTTVAAGYPINGTPQTLDGTAAFSIPAADAGWNIGQSVWDVASGVEEAGGLWIRGDETGRVLQRSASSWAADTSTHLITGSDRIVTVNDTVDRANPDWANSVFINYPNASTGAGTTDYGNAGSGSIPRRSVVLTRTSKRVKTGDAQARATRMNKRGRILLVTAIADLTCRPNQTYRVQYRGYDWTTTVQRVMFRSDGLMDLTLNVIES